MRGVVLALFALTGCDRVWVLQHVDYEASDAGDDGATADLLISDGPTFAACKTPFPATGQGRVVLSGYSEGTRAEMAQFGIAMSAGNAYYFKDSDPPVPIGPQSSAWSRPALTPDGSQLYMFNSAGQAYRFQHVIGASWSTGESMAPSIAVTKRPGNVGFIPGTNEMRMMVYEGTELREHASTDGGVTWPVSSMQTRSLTELTGLVGGTIDYQGLTPDAATLLFTVIGSTSDGVWYIRRTDYDINNNFSTANTGEYGRLLALTGAKTPYLDSNCSLFIGYGNDLIQYDPPL